MRKFRWVLVWNLLFGFLMADDYRTITRPSGVDIQKFKRVALVIGNDNYENGKLSHAVEDSRAMRDFLNSKGFKVIYTENSIEKTMRKKIHTFLKSLDSQSVGFVYFAGHGIQEFSQKYKKTMNYLIPIDNNKLNSITDLDYSTISLDYILDSLSAKENGFNIVLLDACRTPFQSFSRTVQDGLAPSNAQGVYIAYATASGDKALDNGLFRKSFIKNAKQPLKLIDILENVKVEVYRETDQTPFTSNGKRGSFYFTEARNNINNYSQTIQKDSRELEVCKYLSFQEKEFYEILYERAIQACRKVDGIIGEGYVGKNLQRFNKYDEAKMIFKRINSKLQKMCLNEDNSDACYLASFYFYGVLHKQGEGMEFLKKSSKLGNPISTYVLGKMYQKGKGVKKDESKALILYQKSCDLEFNNACSQLGSFYKNNNNIKKALALYKKACNKGHTSSCSQLGYFYKDNNDYINAIKFYQKGCNNFTEHSCVILSRIYAEGHGMKKDKIKGRKMFKKSCKARNINKNTCMGLMYDGDMFFRKDIKKAQDFFLKGCDSDDKLGCSILGDKYSDRKVKSIKFYTKACLLKDRRSCEKLIKIYFKEGNKIKENLFHRKACMLGTQKSCRKINY